MGVIEDFFRLHFLQLALIICIGQQSARPNLLDRGHYWLVSFLLKYAFD